MSTQLSAYLTPEQYLKIERAAERKSEYYDGEMFAMDGAREGHNLIVANLISHLGQQLRSKPCRVYPSDMRVRLGSTTRYSYPDVVVVSGEPQFLDEQFDTLLNPTLLVEVLSPSSESFDRGRKFGYYRSIDSLRDYLMVSSERMSADLYTRQPDGRWLLAMAAEEPRDAIEIPSINCRVTLSDIYDKVEFTPPPRILSSTS